MSKHVAEKPPAPGTAPWAPHIVYAPLPRWPVVIPLGLLAVLAAGAWLLLEQGHMPPIASLTGSL
ncbi:hypothetical protein G5V57_10065 [Nordella sp. HKS 07]|uniref:hypothetical protein n=1 Tax=Nordella sp. HKS 07 TaxID=2712222 RepID=UPI0013E11FB3|nr:hypothetical protein [Nordella sp. HKS 07]QIG48037.1 hypothetical protein G5V57_10065 [Nordella sp. HKS 07]